MSDRLTFQCFVDTSNLGHWTRGPQEALNKKDGFDLSMDIFWSAIKNILKSITASIWDSVQVSGMTTKMVPLPHPHTMDPST